MARVTCPKCNHRFEPTENKIPLEWVEEVFDQYQQKIHAKARLTDGGTRKIRSRLRNYTINDLVTAMERFSQDRWWMEHNAKRGVAWFFNSDDRIEQFINIEPRGGLKTV